MNNNQNATTSNTHSDQRIFSQRQLSPTEKTSTQNIELLKSLKKLIQEERRLTREILEKINLVEERRLYAELGYTSLYEWLVKDLGYSHGAAHRRMQAARLLKAVPETSEDLQVGSVNLTTLSQVQTTLRAEERRTGQKVAVEKKKEMLQRIQNKSSEETGFLLAQIFPEAKPQQEKVRPLSDEDVRVSLTLNKEQMKKLKRVQELASHSHFNASLADIIEMLSDRYLKTKDPLVHKKPKAAQDCPELPSPSVKTSTKTNTLNTKPQTQRLSAADSKTPIRRKALSVTLKKQIWRRDHGACIYKDPRTGHLCGSRFQVEVDHIRPRALGGDDRADNLRCLCRTHNLLMAERHFGTAKIRKFQKNLD